MSAAATISIDAFVGFDRSPPPSTLSKNLSNGLGVATFPLPMTETQRNPPVTNPEEWVEKYGDYLFRFALLRLRNNSAAEDAVQETFLAGVKGLHRFDGKVDVKYWLRGILKNKIVDHIRKSSRETPVENLEEFEPEDSVLMKYSGIPTTRPVPWAFDIHQAFDREEFWSIFHDALAQLKGPIQQAFTLKEIEGLSTEEICSIMKISPNNLWVMIHRARQQLKTILEQRWGTLKD